MTTRSPQFDGGRRLVRQADVGQLPADTVMDSAAENARDVDVTVIVNDAETGKYAFKPYEPKHEAASLDVSEVEQLCMKFPD